MSDTRTSAGVGADQPAGTMDERLMGRVEATRDLLSAVVIRDLGAAPALVLMLAFSDLLVSSARSHRRECAAFGVLDEDVEGFIRTVMDLALQHSLSPLDPAPPTPAEAG